MTTSKPIFFCLFILASNDLESIEKTEPSAKLHASRKLMILALLDKTRYAGLIGGGEDILGKVGELPPNREAADTLRMSDGHLQSEPARRAKGRFYAAKSFALGSNRQGNMRIKVNKQEVELPGEASGKDVAEKLNLR